VSEVARTIERAGAGLAVPPDSPVEFRGALAELLDDRDRSDQMGASGRLFVERWASPAAVAESYENLFAELIERRHSRR